MSDDDKPKRRLDVDPEGGELGFLGGSMIALGMFMVLLAAGVGVVAAFVFGLRCAWEAGG